MCATLVYHYHIIVKTFVPMLFIIFGEQVDDCIGSNCLIHFLFCSNDFRLLLQMESIHIMQVKEKIPKNLTTYLLHVLYTYFQRVAAL